MDVNQILDENTETELVLTDEAKGYLKTAAIWARFIAFIGFVGVGFMLIAGFSIGAMSAMIEEQFPLFPISAGKLSTIYIIIALLYAIPIWLLFKFSSTAKEAISMNNVSSLTNSMSFLGKHFKFLGIMIIVFLVLYFALLGMILTSGFGGT